MLDVATGTGLVAAPLVEPLGLPGRRARSERADAERARAKLARDPAWPRGSTFVEGEAEALPFADGEFDHLTFTYLLRYVDDPAATLRELARVVRPGGRIASLEFCVPARLWFWPWRLYTRVGLPALGRLVSRSWFEAGRFLGPSIEGFYRNYPLGRQLELWRGGRDRAGQARRMSLGGGVVIWGTRWRLTPPPARAFYALRPGGWRDLVTVLHPPYTLWHVSYVAIGAAAAPQIHAGRLVAAIAAFFLAVGVGAHALDELNGRPLGTQLSERASRPRRRRPRRRPGDRRRRDIFVVSATLLPLVLSGAFLAPAYNLELFAGRFHTDFWLAASWGGFSALTGWWVNSLGLHSVREAIAASAAVLACFFLTVVQRRLSTPVRELRRRTVSVEGEQGWPTAASGSCGARTSPRRSTEPCSASRSRCRCWPSRRWRCGSEPRVESSW